MSQEDGTAVLCVDDEPHVLSALQRTFRREPYEVVRAGAGGEALKILERCPVKVVISDQRMSGMTGTELLAEIRRRKPGVGLILLTAYGGAEAMARGLEAGIDFLMTKPWDEDRLRLAVRRLLREVDRLESPAEGAAEEMEGRA
jgi:DNA-binding response OmpR family regulator